MENISLSNNKQFCYYDLIEDIKLYCVKNGYKLLDLNDNNLVSNFRNFLKYYSSNDIDL
jgi:hypothetical protein